ncbi:calcium/proton exchanger [Methylococcus geothermalis]|uniref:Ca(2+)/H(+) antiporter n=1 Tax=Methylococcus geothermalis TaxID=2681310 RepID=A0A858QA71_9GAMM|nr:calcium/proton exchanger [Methylococcus geothermalis]QJD30723.1 calcium/proton exchanger [Methylococcus geothermalis]
MKFLLAFIPLAVIFEHSPSVPAGFRFAAAALAIIPLAAAMVDATERISHRTGPTVGGLLNATFGNAPELIISLMALRAGLIEVVKASIVGVILSNLLFVLGLAFLLGGLRFHVQKFNRHGARIQRAVLMVAAISIVVPSVFDNFIPPEMIDREDGLNICVALVLLATYALSLVFMLKTHPDYFVSEDTGLETGALPDSTGTKLAVAHLAIASAILALMSEILVGSIEGTAASLGMSKAFIGVIILALIGGAPESVAAVTVARRNKLDLTMGIAVGSSVQIALFVAPVLVLSSYVMAPRTLNLMVGNAGIMIIMLPVLLLSMLVGDGRSNWFKGVQLLSVYLLIALFCYFLPDTPGTSFFGS